MNERIVRTSASLPCEARRAWEKVCFYEHIELPPSWLLRTVLPVPERTTGAYRKAGDVSRCQYSDGGYLTKRIGRIDGTSIEFDVIEQSIRYAGHIALRGGTIRIAAREDGTCGVEMLTRYALLSPWLTWVRRPIEYVIGAMHRIVLRDMHAKLAGSARANPSMAPAPALIDLRRDSRLVRLSGPCTPNAAARLGPLTARPRSA